MSIAAVLLAAGEGKRFGYKKQWVNLLSKPVVAWSLEVFEGSEYIDAVYLGVNQEDIDLAESFLKKYVPSKGKAVFVGGRERYETVYNSFSVVEEDVVVIHDAARPFLTYELLERLIDVFLKHRPDGVIPVMPVYDTLKVVKNGMVVKTINREEIYRVQTPQVFLKNKLFEAYRRFFLGEIKDKYIFTDDASFVEACGGRVMVVQGDYRNLKITRKEDMDMALSMVSGFKIGFGYDIHKTVKGNGFYLGGVFIKSDYSLLGHSDADVLIHALVDAILGAYGAGDIGEWFPDSDSRYRGVKSRLFIEEVVKKLNPTFLNIDATIVMQRPKLADYKKRIKNNIAEMLEVSPDIVNIKAKTKEGLDSVGKGEAVEAYVVVLLR